MNQKLKKLAEILTHLGHSEEAAKVGFFVSASEIYKIKSGDNPWSLANGDAQYHEAILNANPDVDWNRLQIGQEIILPEKPSYPNKGMSPSDNAFQIIKEHEKLRLTPYDDGYGNITVGYGHVLNKGEAYSTITEQQADNLLSQDAGIASKAIIDLVKVKLNQNQFDALVSLIFNVGRGAFARSSLLEYLNAGDFKNASKAFGLFTKAGGRENPHLIKRRAVEATLFAS